MKRKTIIKLNIRAYHIFVDWWPYPWWGCKHRRRQSWHLQVCFQFDGAGFEAWRYRIQNLCSAVCCRRSWATVDLARCCLMSLVLAGILLEEAQPPLPSELLHCVVPAACTKMELEENYFKIVVRLHVPWFTLTLRAFRGVTVSRVKIG